MPFGVVQSGNPTAVVMGTEPYGIKVGKKETTFCQKQNKKTNNKSNKQKNQDFQRTQSM